MVTGDCGKDRFIYLEEFPDKPANLREAWVNASRFWTVPLDGGSGCLIQLLKELGIEAFDPCGQGDHPAESIYILTKRKVGKGWSISQSIVAGEREFPSGDLKACDPAHLKKDIPAVVMDFNQGWLKQNKGMIHDLLKKRLFVIRTHDPRKRMGRGTQKGYC